MGWGWVGWLWPSEERGYQGERQQERGGELFFVLAAQQLWEPVGGTKLGGLWLLLRGGGGGHIMLGCCGSGCGDIVRCFSKTLPRACMVELQTFQKTCHIITNLLET